MKLALIRRQFSATGGAELYLHRFLEALAARGHTLHLFTESWPAASPGIVVHAAKIACSRATRARRFAEAVRAETAKEHFDCVFSLDRTLRQDVYRAGDGVHRVWLMRRRQFAAWWRKPFTGLGSFHKMMLKLEAETFRPQNTRHIIANSEMVKREILDYFQFPAERIHVIRNGVDVSRCRRGDRAATRARFGVAEEEFLLLFVGSGWERKGLPFLLKAMFKCLDPTSDWPAQFQEGIERAIAQATRLRPAVAIPGNRKTDFLRRIKLLVVGKGQKPFRCPGNVVFAGPMVDVENAYAAADLFVFLPIYEPSANVVFEALAARLPVVTSALNGASELIRDGVNGTVIADPSDTQRLVQAIGYWWARQGCALEIDENQVSLGRNIRETLAVLELAAEEKSK